VVGWKAGEAEVYMPIRTRFVMLVGLLRSLVANENELYHRIRGIHHLRLRAVTRGGILSGAKDKRK
jgi:hypothetical protein